jgi:hypothetical protein
MAMPGQAKTPVQRFHTGIDVSKMGASTRHSQSIQIRMSQIFKIKRPSRTLVPRKDAGTRFSVT